MTNDDDDDQAEIDRLRGGASTSDGKPRPNTADASQTVAAGQLRSFVERVERLDEDKKAIADDIKDVFAEMKGTGFDTKAVRTILRLRQRDKAEREEEEAILDLYKAALGMD